MNKSIRMIVLLKMKRLFFLVAGFLVISTSPTHADIIFDTFGPAGSYNPYFSLLFGTFETGSSYDQARRFTPTMNYILDSISFPLKNDSGSTLVNIRITNDIDGLPNSISILEMTDVMASPQSSIVTAYFSGSTILNHDSTYWVWVSSPGLQLWHEGPCYYDLGYYSTTGGDTWSYNAGCDPAFRVEGTFFIDLDIKPRSSLNKINLKSKGAIPVAILTTEVFDATTVDPLSVSFGPNHALPAHGRGHIQDVDGDGDLDLVFRFKTEETGIACGDTEAILTGETFDGQVIEGIDSIQTVKCN